jgi:hypothetical protein
MAKKEVKNDIPGVRASFLTLQFTFIFNKNGTNFSVSLKMCAALEDFKNYENL